jgi:hypothetical protein
MKFTNIYTLRDPETNQIRYVGKSNNISQRYKAHLNKARKHQTHKKNWIDSLKQKGLKPIIEIIDVVPIEDWVFWETFWISQCKTWGFNLVNHTSGGDGCTFTNGTSFKGENAIPILQVDKNGNIIKEFKSILLAQKELNTQIFRAIDKNKSSAGFLWLRKSTYENMTENEFKDFIKTFNTKKRTINSGSFKSGNKPWNANNVEYKLTGKKTAKSVLQFDLYNNFIKKHYSCKEASKEMMCIEENIRRVCVGKSKTAKGFIWKYE